MQEQDFSIEADAKSTPAMRDTAAAMVQRTRTAWQGSGEMPPAQQGRPQPLAVLKQDVLREQLPEVA